MDWIQFLQIICVPAFVIPILIKWAPFATQPFKRRFFKTCFHGLSVGWFFYKLGEQWREIKTTKVTLTNVQKAKTIRDNVVNVDRIRRLHDKYKR